MGGEKSSRDASGKRTHHFFSLKAEISKKNPRRFQNACLLIFSDKLICVMNQAGIVICTVLLKLNLLWRLCRL
ncbi:hypothetical protein GGC63_000966 [Paenibacillus sp. OAS669]|nr:hypothetical protein [Paenibacillus sp. OAS669]